MKVEGWKFIFRFNLWSWCLVMGWVTWLLYLNLQACSDNFGPWTQREHLSVFRHNFFYTGSRRRILLLQKGYRQRAEWMCIEAANHNFFPHKTGPWASLVPSVSWVNSGCLLKQHTWVQPQFVGFYPGFAGWSPDLHRREDPGITVVTEVLKCTSLRSSYHKHNMNTEHFLLSSFLRLAGQVHP